jgi:hypothetical protein
LLLLKDAKGTQVDVALDSIKFDPKLIGSELKPLLELKVGMSAAVLLHLGSRKSKGVKFSAVPRPAADQKK